MQEKAEKVMTVQANYKDIADNYIRALGGADNIDSLVNCATRIRVIVKNPEGIASNRAFTQIGAINFNLHGHFAQIIIGMDVVQVLEAMRKRLSLTDEGTLDEYGLTPNGERARILYECLGLPDNILNITVIGSAIAVQVVDPDWVDPYDVMLQLNIGIKSLTKHGHLVRIEMDHAMATARELNRLHLRNRR
ncbi:PTS transporter subunit EIIB [Lacticaseibacillus rhamnosus]|uniref:PTS transporter subunit EIIB n=1 Tax=Lacticaseibacillus rhamnosus TaxID=47715 RepID=UPI0005044FF2|nr:PTS transporter subunit EIIB [Lacticaseibacillus rhamnosus]KFK45686.1 PTS sugar transporter subunit IIBC [Lacticaseibacillus rhamnosus]MCT3170351.1 PTS sugar transporter subunit IIBC [Lacticaseibacillus rhamnosus]MCT3177503.1 PTS sugar transporter subunit IIBC [Lacticaseibacillus rhamnosus]MCT3183183.1 PTS sugar transporter subunit IIBC [Lacticaseibacillus rhamnosus]MCT4448438.1 PTS sugar transporter subunit IIBC [Lacticaseibacillus rhamnosus]